MKILYVITGLGGGGAEKVVVNLADKMCLKGHEVKIAYLKGNVVVQPENKEIELVCLGFESFSHVRSAYLNYKKILTKFKPDVVHAHMVHANIFARICRKFFPVPKLVCTAHSNNEGGKLRMMAYRVTHQLSEFTTNVSKSASENFIKLGAVPFNGIQTIYNGIDLQKFNLDINANIKIKNELNLNERKKILLAVGRFHEAKDYPNLLNAFSMLLKNFSGDDKPYLLIAGDGEIKPDIEGLILELNLQDYIFLLGRRDDIVQLMSAADIFVLSSSFEGFGLVVAEAMACETFVVATDCGGVKEVMGDTGILVETQDSQALADAIISVMNMPAASISNNNMKALQHIQKNFDLNAVVAQWLEIYEN